MNERYIRAKERWAEKAGERRRRRAPQEPGRLPPGQRLTQDFPVLDLGIRPEFDPESWTLTIDGKVENPSTFSWESFQALPTTEDVADMHCVTTWSKFDCRWGGVPFTEIYERVKPLASAQYVFFRGYDGYTVNVPLAQMLDDDVLLATHFDGNPLSADHGFPLRVIIPKLYAWKGAKFLKSMTFLEQDLLGFWELRGYSNTADPFTEDRFA